MDVLPKRDQPAICPSGRAQVISLHIQVYVHPRWSWWAVETANDRVWWCRAEQVSGQVSAYLAFLIGQYYFLRMPIRSFLNLSSARHAQRILSKPSRENSPLRQPERWHAAGNLGSPLATFRTVLRGKQQTPRLVSFPLILFGVGYYSLDHFRRVRGTTCSLTIHQDWGYCRVLGFLDLPYCEIYSRRHGTCQYLSTSHYTGGRDVMLKTNNWVWQYWALIHKPWASHLIQISWVAMNPQSSRKWRVTNA